MTLASRSAVSETDAQLMTRVRADDALAFRHLYDRHVASALRIASAVCHDAGRAEDAVQEGFLRIWRGRSGYRAGSGSFKSWALQIIRNQAIDSTRREGTRPVVATSRAEESDSDQPSVSAEVIARSEARSLRDLLGRLPEAQSTVITLAFFGELSHSEIARRLSLPAGTVKGRMRLGMNKLRRELQADE